MDYLCYTDGSCKAGEGAPGGWGFSIRTPTGGIVEGYGKAKGTLSKVMEYQAVAEALEALPVDVGAQVFSDDQSLIENLSKSLAIWAARDFAKVDPLILPSVKRIHAVIATQRLSVTWTWLRSHNGNLGNTRADELAVQGAREAKAELAAEAEAKRKAARRR